MRIALKMVVLVELVLVSLMAGAWTTLGAETDGADPEVNGKPVSFWIKQLGSDNKGL